VSRPADAFLDGALLGMSQGNAILGPPAAVSVIVFGPWFASAPFVLASLFGWFVWWHDYRFALWIGER
jgi:hypothetical protein